MGAGVMPNANPFKLQALVEFPDHLHSQRALVIKDLAHAIAFADHWLQVFYP